MLSRDLIGILTIDQMLEDYYLGHKMDKDVYFNKKKELLGVV